MKKSWDQNGKICHFWVIPRSGTGTKTWVVTVPPYRGQMVQVPRLSGTGTTHQNRFGTSTNPSGTSTTYSCSLDFGILTLLSSNSNTEGIATLIND